MIKKQQNAGFTLIEMMIGVAIIGIIASVAIPSYQSYILRTRITEAVVGLDAMRIGLSSHIQMYNKIPSKVNGIKRQSGVGLSGSKTKVIEGYRFDGSDTKAWFVVRLNQGILPEENLNIFKREIHLGIVKTKSGKWVSFCGTWKSSAMIDVKYLPNGCDVDGVAQALENAEST